MGMGLTCEAVPVEMGCNGFAQRSQRSRGRREKEKLFAAPAALQLHEAVLEVVDIEPKRHLQVAAVRDQERLAPPMATNYPCALCSSAVSA
jgi:hypothetical protein